MSIVFAKNKEEQSTMVSTGTQADISDPEGVLGVIRSFNSQLQDLKNANQSLLDMEKAREGGVETSNQLSNQLTERLSGLLDSAHSMENTIVENTETMSSMDQNLQDLLNEKERLDAIVGGQQLNVSDADISSEERLTGFVEEELSRKIDELSNLHSRLSETREEYKSEWDQFKTDLQQYETDKATYTETADHLQELQLAKFVGAHSGNGSGGSLVKRLVEHHINQLTHRDLNKQMTHARLQEKDLETEIGDLVKQKQQLWKRCLDLERSLEEIQDTSEETSILRPASAFSALPDVCDGIEPTSGASELDLVEDQGHGKMLHRCHKNINLVVDLSSEEFETTEVTLKADVGPTDAVQTSQLDQTPEATTSAADDKEEPEDQEPEQDEGPDQDPSQPSQTEESTKGHQHMPSHLRAALGHADENVTFVNKLRKRVGLSGRSSSSQKIKGGTKLGATGSTRHFGPGEFLRRKR